MDTYQTINDVLVRLFREIMDQEQKAIITEESSVAKSLSVTVGTLTIAVNALVKKGYVDRVRSEADRRVVLLSLTEKGEKAYYHHEKFHRDMVDAVIGLLSPEEQVVLAKALTNLSEFFRKF